MSRMMSLLLIAAVSLALIGCKQKSATTTKAPPRGQGEKAQAQPPTTVGGQQGTTAGGEAGTTAQQPQPPTTAGGKERTAAGGQAGTAGAEQPTTVGAAERAKVQETGAKSGGTQK
jgi:hypothetical protein